MKRVLLFAFFVFGLLVATGQTQVPDGNKSVVIQTNQSISDVSAYPNPFTIKSTISFTSDKIQDIYFELKNVLGKSVYRFKYNAKEGDNSLEILRDNLPNGMYIYSLQTDTEIISKRLVIR